MLQYNQFFIVELGSHCNLGKIHDKCPTSKRIKKDTNLDDEKIIQLVTEAYTELGFKGYVGFHYYNEPMLQWERMLGLIAKIRENIPTSRFVLWTNGTVLIDDKRFDDIEFVVVTNYANKPHEVYSKIYRNELLVIKENFDNRIAYEGYGNSSPCTRTFIEFIVDCWGDVRMCCQDWEGRIIIGNVYDKPLKELVEKKLELSLAIARRISSNNEVCFNCNGRASYSGHDKEIDKKTLEFISNIL